MYVMGHRTDRLGLSLTIAITLSGCVSQASHQAVLADLERTKAEAGRLSDQNQILTVELANRSKELEALRQKLETLEAHGQTQTADVELLNQRNLELSSEASILHRQNQGLSEMLESQTYELETKIEELSSLTRTQAEDLDVFRSRLEELEQAQQTAMERLKSTYHLLSDALGDEVKRNEVQIALRMDRLGVRLPETVLFDSGSVDIKPEGQKILDRVGVILKEVTGMKIEIQGHTDDVPIGSRLASRFPTNWELSTTRASSVVRYFVEKSGVTPTMLFAAGFADSHPVADNATKEGRTANRRIEIVLSPSDMEYPFR